MTNGYSSSFYRVLCTAHSGCADRYLSGCIFRSSDPDRRSESDGSGYQYLYRYCKNLVVGDPVLYPCWKYHGKGRHFQTFN